VSAFPPSVDPPEFPSNCVMRASTHLRLARLGLVDMESADHDRILLGYFTVAVFGRSCTLALQRLKHWDEAAFLKWYEPWATAMKNDPLCQFFYELRTEIVHGVTPIPGVMLAAFGPSAPQVGAIYIPEDKVPTEHKGQPIEDRSARNLSRLYVEYLQEIFDSFLTIVWDIDDRERAAWFEQFSQS
jgi:hypothetical protein